MTFSTLFHVFLTILDISVFWPGDCIQKKPGEPSLASETRGMVAPTLGMVVVGTRVMGYGVVVDQWCVPVVWVRACPTP